MPQEFIQMEAYLESFGILNYVKKKKVQESHQFFWNLIFSVAIFHGSSWKLTVLSESA